MNSHSVVKYSSLIPLLNFIEFYEVGGNGTAGNGSAVTINPNITTITPVRKSSRHTSDIYKLDMAVLRIKLSSLDHSSTI